MPMFRVAAFVAATVLHLLAPAAIWAHEGHDDAPERAMQSEAAPRAQASSHMFELVAELRGTTLTLWLDRFDTNEPVDGATITLKTAAQETLASPAGRGVYTAAAQWAATPGKTDLVATIVAGDATEVMPLTLTVTAPTREAPHASADALHDLVPLAVAGFVGLLAGGLLTGVKRRRAVAALALVSAAMWLLAPSAFAHDGDDHGASAPPSLTGAAAQRLPDGTLFVPKAVQRVFDLRTVPTQAGAFSRVRELPGRIVPDPRASGLVQAAIGGRLSPPEGGFPLLGAVVKKGEVLAYVTPPIQAVDASDMRQKQGELDQQIAIAERRLKRYEMLFPAGGVPRSQLEDTQTELQGLNDRRVQIEKFRREPEALVAPLDGVIADGGAIAGQMAQPNAVVFNIIDPARLWVEALSFDAVPGVATATARLANGQTFALSYRGAGFADRNQSIPVHFAIEAALPGMRVGQFVTVLLATHEIRNGIALPRSSVVRSSNGQDVVFAHVSAEIFRALPVRTEHLDGVRVLVLAGVEPGQRIVTQAGELLDQVR